MACALADARVVGILAAPPSFGVREIQSERHYSVEPAASASHDGGRMSERRASPIDAIAFGKVGLDAHGDRRGGVVVSSPDEGFRRPTPRLLLRDVE